MKGKIGSDEGVNFADTGGWTRLKGPEFTSDFRSAGFHLHCHRAGGGLVFSITVSIHTITCSLNAFSITEYTEFDRLGTPSSMIPDIHFLTLL
jgi:hypothetical protein